MSAETDRKDTSSGVPARVKGLSVVSLFNDVASEMVYPLLPAFITRTLGAVLGSVAAWWLLSRGTDVRSVIGWSVVPGVIAFVVLVVVLRGARSREPGAGSKDATETPKAAGSKLPASSYFWPPILALTALTFFRLPEALLILRLQDRGVALAAIPLVWGGLHVVRSLSSYPGGWLSDHLGP